MVWPVEILSLRCFTESGPCWAMIGSAKLMWVSYRVYGGPVMRCTGL